jgi:hypothetical protein
MNTNSALIIPSQSAAAGKDAALTLQDVKPPVYVSNGWLWLWWTLGAVALAVALFFLGRYWRKKNPTPLPPPIPPHDRARRKLEQALALLGEPKLFAITVSDILRVYLEERFQFHAPERTTEEFFTELQYSNYQTHEQKQSLMDFLSNCDLVKFARYEPTEVELRALHASALTLVNETEPPPFAPSIGSSQPPIPAANPVIQ